MTSIRGLCPVPSAGRSAADGEAGAAPSLPLWREDGRYPVQELADWFLTQAESIGRRFDQRNRSHYFEDDLAATLGTMHSVTFKCRQYISGNFWNERQ